VTHAACEKTFSLHRAIQAKQGVTESVGQAADLVVGILSRERGGRRILLKKTDRTLLAADNSPDMLEVARRA
jgi:hypothetical protein